MQIALQALQIGADLRGVLVTQFAVLFQRLADDFIQLRREFRTNPCERNRRSVQNRIMDDRGTAARKRHSASRHFVQHRAKREQIRSCIEFFAASLFRGHVGNGAQGRAGRCDQFFCGGCWHRGCADTSSDRSKLRQTEIQNLGVPALRHEDVRWLDIAMNDVFSVCRVECLRNLRPQFQHLLQWQRLAVDAMFQGLPLQEFHYDESPFVLLINLVDGADVRMVQGRGGLRLALKAREGLRVSRHIIR